MEPVWKNGKFLVAELTGIREAEGFLYRGLAMKKITNGSPKGRRPPTWVLAHCGSGHGIFHISANMIEAFNIATEIAELGDWTFEGFYGWINQFPDMKICIVAMLDKYPKQLDARFDGLEANEDFARAVAMARA